MKIITLEKYNQLLEDWITNKDIGKQSYLLKVNDRYIAVDNNTNDFWTEEFETIDQAKEYLGIEN